MARDARINLPWPDGRRDYRLGIGEIRELQEKCNKGPLEILADLQSGRWRLDDILQPIRLGMVGGGLGRSEAVLLAERHVTPGNLGECSLYAMAIVNAAITGAPDEPLKFPKDAVAAGKQEPEAAGSNSRLSTRKARRSAGRRTRSTQ